MRVLLIVAFVLTAAVPCSARDISQAYVTLTSPPGVSPGETYTFVFWVQNNSPDSEWITDVAITFPAGFMLHDGTIGYTPILEMPLHPSWDMYTDETTAWWVDNNAGYGELWNTEGTDVWIDATVPTASFEPQIFWELFGDEWGAEPHYVSGFIEIAATPVEPSSWTSIKALFR